MGVEHLVHSLGLSSSVQLDLVCSSLIWLIPVCSGSIQQAWLPLVCTISSGLLIQMRVVLQVSLVEPYGWWGNIHVPHIKDLVEPLMAAPVLCLGVLDSSRMAGHFQVFQAFQQGLALLLVVPEGSGEFWKALEGPGRLWRLLEWSAHNWIFLGEPGGVWMSGGHV